MGRSVSPFVVQEQSGAGGRKIEGGKAATIKVNGKNPVYTFTLFTIMCSYHLAAYMDRNLVEGIQATETICCL